MIMCVCRNISDQDFPCPVMLKERLLEDDAVCCICHEIIESETDSDPSQEGKL